MFPLEPYFLLAYPYYPEMDLALCLYYRDHYFVQLAQSLEQPLVDAQAQLVYFPDLALDLVLAEDQV